MRTVRMLLVAELDIGDDESGDISKAAQNHFDAFRKVIGASAEHGVTFARATSRDVVTFRYREVEPTDWVPVRPVPERLFQVHEWADGFKVEYIPTRDFCRISNHDGEDQAFSPDEPGSRELWEKKLNATPDETLEAYFPCIAEEKN